MAIAKNKIGWVATLIGRVQSSVPEAGQPEGLFHQRQQKFSRPKSFVSLRNHKGLGRRFYDSLAIACAIAREFIYKPVTRKADYQGILADWGN